jgi:hypothetical protein
LKLILERERGPEPPARKVVTVLFSDVFVRVAGELVRR